MVPGVNVQEENGLIGGSIATSDNVTGVVLTGAGGGTLPLLTPVMVVSLADAVSKGITNTAEPEAYDFVTQFYNMPNTLGVAVYIMLVANTSSLVSLCDQTNASGVKKLLDFANGTIRVLGVTRSPSVGYTPVTPGFIDSDVISAATNAQTLAVAMFAKHTPVRILLNARVADVTSTTVVAPNTLAFNKVGMVLGSAGVAGFSVLGTVLGCVAGIAPHVCLGKVKKGALPLSSFYIGGQPISPNPTNPNALWYQQVDSRVGDGFIVIKKYAQKAGLFIANDPMACPVGDDYSTLANGRVIDKAAIISYQTYLNEVNDDVDLDDNNLLEPVVVKALEAEIENSLNLNMSASMSGSPVVYIDQTQPIVSDEMLNVQLRVRPKGYTKQINVSLGFNPSTT